MVAATFKVNEQDVKVVIDNETDPSELNVTVFVAGQEKIEFQTTGYANSVRARMGVNVYDETMEVKL